LFATALGVRPLFAESPNDAKADDVQKQASELMNLLSKTGGGKQLPQALR